MYKIIFDSNTGTVTLGIQVEDVIYEFLETSETYEWHLTDIPRSFDRLEKL